MKKYIGIDLHSNNCDAPFSWVVRYELKTHENYYEDHV